MFRRVFVLFAAALAVPLSAQSPMTIVETVASYPSGAFLENLSVGPDGGVIVTSYADKRLLAWAGSGAPRTLVTLDAHPVGILARAGDIIVSAHGASFMAGPGFAATNRMLVLDRQGSLLRSTPAPDARFLNGLVELAPNLVLAADSIAGRIWRFDPASGALSAWLDDPALAPVAGSVEQRPGANGLKRRGDWLYISNSSRGALSRVRIKDGAPAGAIETVAAPGPVDDFAFLPDGSIVATTHGAQLLRIAPDGAVSTILERGCDGCTSVARLDADLIVLTTGGLLEGGKQPARILRLGGVQ